MKQRKKRKALHLGAAKQHRLREANLQSIEEQAQKRQEQVAAAVDKLKAIDGVHMNAGAGAVGHAKKPHKHRSHGKGGKKRISHKRYAALKEQGKLQPHRQKRKEVLGRKMQ